MASSRYASPPRSTRATSGRLRVLLSVYRTYRTRRSLRQIDAEPRQGLRTARRITSLGRAGRRAARRMLRRRRAGERAVAAMPDEPRREGSPSLETATYAVKPRASAVCLVPWRLVFSFPFRLRRTVGASACWYHDSTLDWYPRGRETWRGKGHHESQKSARTLQSWR